MSDLTERGRDESRDGDGCGFLATAELEALLEGALPEARFAALQGHARDGCGACALLLADAEVFRGAARGGAHSEGASGADRDASVIRAWLARQQHPARRRSAWSTAWRTAAAAAVLIGVVFVTQRNTIESGGRTAITLPGGESFEFTPMPFSAPSVLRGERDLTQRWSEAGTAYAAGHYTEAARVFADLSRNDTESVDAVLYEGIAWLAAGRAQECLTALDQAERRARTTGDDDDAIRWFRALAMARLDRVDEARPILEGLAVLPSRAGVPDAIDFPSQARRLLAALQGRTSTSNAPQ